MKFCEALVKMMIDGEKIKTKYMLGYIYWDERLRTIMGCGADGIVTRLDDDINKINDYVFIFKRDLLNDTDEWIIATSENTPFLKPEKSNKIIVVINGSGGVGKDTFVNYVSDKLPTMRVSSVDKIKDAAQLLGWDSNCKNEKDRKFLSDLKLLCMDYNDHSYNYIKEKIEEFKLNDVHMLFIMVREPKEIERLRKDFGAVALMIINDRVQAIVSNVGDANVNDFNYDYVVHNNQSLKDLDEEASKFTMWVTSYINQTSVTK